MWLSWNLKPMNGGRGVEWETLYGYGMENAGNATVGDTCGPEGSLACLVGGKDKVEWWEFTVTNNEIKAFTERVPNYLDSCFIPSS